MNNKTFVLDTNVLLHNPASFESFADNSVVIPLAVIEELDKFKSHNDELGRNSRQVIRQIDRLRQRGKLGEGITMENGGVLRVVYDEPGEPMAMLPNLTADNRIIGVAYRLQKYGERVIFVSKDINARVKSDALGIETMDYEKQTVKFDELFTGYRSLQVPKDRIDVWHQSETMTLPELDAYPNEFILMEAEDDPSVTAIGRAVNKTDLIHLTPKGEFAWNLKPRSIEQRMALELLMDDSISLVTLVGQAGTGKTLLALAAGLEQIIRIKRYDKMLVTRPIMPLGKDIGYLPGDKESKLMNWMQPIFDNLAYLMRDMTDPKHTVRERVEKLQRDHVVELEALTYIRGRSIPKQYVIIDEAQNLTPHEIKTIISRAGEGTKMVLTGDPSQIDNPYLDSNSNGLSYTVERMKSECVHGHITLVKSERSQLAAIAASLL